MDVIRRFIDGVLYPIRMLSRVPSQLISSPRRMLGLSLPLRAALLLFFALVVVFVVFVISNLFSQDTGDFWRWFWRIFWPVLALLVAIPAIVWYALKLWLEGESSPFPEIDRAWNTALAALKERSIDPTETPLFLVLGPGNEEQVMSFLEASNQSFAVSVPVGDAPLHLFANQQSIYVVCTETSQLGLVCSGGEQSTISGDIPAAQGGSFDPGMTMQIGGPAPSGMPQAQPAAPARPDLPAGLAGVQVPGAPGAPEGGTLAANKTASVEDFMRAANAQAPMAPAAVSEARLAPGESSQATQRLQHVCSLIRRMRAPLCPANGVIVATPFTTIADGSDSTANQLLASLKSDLACLRRALRLRCGVTHVICGMEQEPGFRELVRRVGAGRAASQRFGKGYGIWNPPTPDQLQALVQHACGAFEDWSYLLFREDDGLGKPGNRHLYSLLCRIRSTFLSRLSHLIAAGYSVEPTATGIESREPLLFSGCYFVANGPTPDRQAFLASVFKKATSEEEEIQWGSEAIAEENRMQSTVQLLLIINGILVAAIVAMVIHSSFYR